MLLHASPTLLKSVNTVERAMAILAAGYRTADMKGSEQDNIVGCREMSKLFAEAVR